MIAAYAAAMDEGIAGVTLVAPPASHMASGAPQFLNVLRICDVPDTVGALAPRPVRVVGSHPAAFARSVSAYAAAGAEDKLSLE